MQRQEYHAELIEYLLKKHYDVTLSRPKNTEAPLPRIRIDMLFEIPKAALAKSFKCPFPFKSLPAIEANKEEIVEILQKISPYEKNLFFFWFKKLQPDFYEREIEMAIDMKAIIKEIYPPEVLDEVVNEKLAKVKEEMLAKAKEEILEKAREEMLAKAKEEILEKAKEARCSEAMDNLVLLLESRYGELTGQIKEQLGKVKSLDELHALFKEALKTQSLDDFTKILSKRS